MMPHIAQCNRPAAMTACYSYPSRCARWDGDIPAEINTCTKTFGKAET
jgi:hypothetical protein